MFWLPSVGVQGCLLPETFRDVGGREPIDARNYISEAGHVKLFVGNYLERLSEI
jgi:hypothetical protein